jgi:hypothetical protein
MGLVVLLNLILVSPVFPQQAGSGHPTAEQQDETKQELQQALRRTHRAIPEPVSSLRLLDCFVEVTDDHSPDRAPREIRITREEQGTRRLLYDRREQDMFLYMLPLDSEESLLATAWESATTANVRVFRIKDSDVKLVMEDSSLYDWPQFVLGSRIVLLGRGREMRGNLILPTHDEIWQWSSRDEKFVLRKRVPYQERWSELEKWVRPGADQ